MEINTNKSLMLGGGGRGGGGGGGGGHALFPLNLEAFFKGGLLSCYSNIH